MRDWLLWQLQQASNAELYLDSAFKASDILALVCLILLSLLVQHSLMMG
jgi:hypothetical protein